MRWLILTDDFPPLDGGVATWTALVAAGLRDAGDRVTVLARHRAGLEGAIGVRGFSFGRRGGWWMDRAARAHLGEVDRVLATTWPVATRVVDRCAAAGLPLDVVLHGSDVTRAPLDPEGRRRVLEGATRRLAVSRYLASVVPGAEVLPAPVDVRRVERTPPAWPTRWVFVGRATGLKGGDRFVRLVRAAGAEGLVVGDGPDLERWRRLAAEIGAAVRFPGRLPREQVLELLSSQELAFLLPRTDADGSGAEGFGLTLVEAAACGVATVGCRTGGVPEAVGEGLLLDDPDQAEASVEAIRAWWTPERGAACRRRVEREHGVRRVVERLRRG